MDSSAWTPHCTAPPGHPQRGRPGGGHPQRRRPGGGHPQRGRPGRGLCPGGCLFPQSGCLRIFYKKSGKRRKS